MATIWPCDKAIDCDCADANPLGNFSSENPDPFTHFARRFGPLPDPGLNDPSGVFVADGCGSACVSIISQEDADACALRMAVQCTQPPGPPNLDDPQLFGNRAMSCQAVCPEGEQFTLNIASGTYLARTQDLADAIARSFCQADVLELRECDMPHPQPPVIVCPHITGQTASPINKNDGDNVSMAVNYTYASTQMLMFVWFFNGVPTYVTGNSSLTLNAVGAGDNGQYILGIYATGCFPVFSSPITLNVTSSCPTEVGAPAPDTLDIEHPVNWETFNIGIADISAVVSSNGLCNPTGLLKATPASQIDKAPGIYGLRWMAGVWQVPAFCAGLYFDDLLVGGRLVNEQYNFDTPSSCGDVALVTSTGCGNYQQLTGDPPPNPGSVPCVGTCYADVATAHFLFDQAYQGYVYLSDPYPPDEAFSFKHTNIGGMFTVCFFEYALPITQFLVEDYILQVVQVAGQIPQPRRVKIDNFGTVAADFTDPAIAANWNGEINVRTTFDSTTLLWSQPASGGFGGATLEWISTHPTSANGFGWKLKIFGAGPTLVWQGIAGKGATPEVYFFKDSTATVLGPDCVSCSDNSATSWSPP